MAHSEIDNYLLEDGSNLLLEDAASVYVIEGAVALILRHGGVRFLREPDPEILEEKKEELAALIKPELEVVKPSRSPKVSASDSQQPPGVLLTAIQEATAKMPRVQQTRIDKLLQQTGISVRELLILLK